MSRGMQLELTSVGMNASNPPTSWSSSADLATLRQSVASVFDGEIDGWFPRAVDERGGFRCGFDQDWRPAADEPKLAVFQARLTWTAATVARSRPGAARLLPFAMHGLAFLIDHLWDARRGGFFWQLDAQGFAPDASIPFKHAYGNAFCIYAAAAVAATGERRAKQLAIDGFAWLDASAHDAVNGGYLEQLALDGKPITSGDDGQYDLIGTPLGQRSINAHIHLLEAFTELYRVWPDATLRARLSEVFEIVRDRMSARGSLPPHFTVDWRATSDVASYGHDVETAFLLLDAAEALGRSREPATLRLAASLWDHTFAHGYDAEHGGLFNEGHAGRPATDRRKIWWVQAEALQSLLALHRHVGHADGRYADAFVRTWQFVRSHQADAKHGGWFAEVSADGTQRLDARKGHAWKASYHICRALLNVESGLGGTHLFSGGGSP